MLDELEGVATGEITVASRTRTLDGVEIREGAYLGLVDDIAVVSGPDLDAVVHEVVDRVLAGGQGYPHDPDGRGRAAARRSRVGARAAASRARGRDPRRRAAALPAPRRRPVTEPAEPIRVLLVEDTDVYRDSLVFLLGARADSRWSPRSPTARPRSGGSRARAGRRRARLPPSGRRRRDGRERAGGPVVFLSASGRPGRVRCRVERRRCARAQGRGDRRSRRSDPRSSREVRT